MKPATAAALFTWSEQRIRSLSGNLITGNADGVLISDETAESHDTRLIHNTVKNNPLEARIVLASHPPSGKTSPPFAPHDGRQRAALLAELDELESAP